MLVETDRSVTLDRRDSYGDSEVASCDGSGRLDFAGDVPANLDNTRVGEAGRQRATDSTGCSRLCDVVGNRSVPRGRADAALSAMHWCPPRRVWS